MTDNPFDYSGTANAPADEVAEAPAVEAAGVRDPEAYVATFKRGKDFHEPWVVIRAATADEMKDRITAYRDSELDKLISETADEFHKRSTPWGGGAATRAANTPPAQPAHNNAPPPAPVPGTVDPAAPAGSCEHGALVLNEWQWNGKQMRRYQCPVKTANRGKGGCDNKVWADKVEQGMPF